MKFGRTLKGLAAALAIYSASCRELPNEEKYYNINAPIVQPGDSVSPIEPVFPEESVFPPRYREQDPDYTSKPKLILSTPTTNGKVNEFYSYKLEKLDNVECYINNKPNWMTLNGGTLEGIPNHVSDEEAGKELVNITCKDEKNNYDFQKYELNIEPGEYCNIFGVCKTYDHIQYDEVPFTKFNGDGDLATYVLLCETGYCPDLFRDNFKEGEEVKYLKGRNIGINRSLEDLLNIIGTKGGYDFDLTFEIHLNRDSTCNDIGGGIMGMAKIPNIVCDYRYNYNESGYIYYDTNCLDPRYPQLCKWPETYLAPESVEINGVTMHEATHTILNGFMEGNFQEHIAYPMGYITSDYNYGKEKIDSFADLYKLFGVGGLEFFKDLNKYFGFDVEDMSYLMSLHEEEFNNGNYWGGGDPKHPSSSKPIPISKIKCMYDKVVGDNTYNIIIYDLCYASFSPTYCNLTNPKSLSYPNPEYCGDY